MDAKEKQREQQEQFEAIEAYRKQRWTADDGVLGPYSRPPSPLSCCSPSSGSAPSGS